MRDAEPDGGSSYPVKITVKELDDGRRFYDHEISQENEESAGYTETGEVLPSLPDPSAADTIPVGQLLAAVKPDFLKSSPAEDEAALADLAIGLQRDLPTKTSTISTERYEHRVAGYVKRMSWRSVGVRSEAHQTGPREWR